jgi:hypothetical protein
MKLKKNKSKSNPSINHTAVTIHQPTTPPLQSINQPHRRYNPSIDTIFIQPHFNAVLFKEE